MDWECVEILGLRDSIAPHDMALQSSPGLPDLGGSPTSLNIRLPLGSIMGRLVQHGVDSVGAIGRRDRGPRCPAGHGELERLGSRPYASDLGGAQRGLGGARIGRTTY